MSADNEWSFEPIDLDFSGIRKSDKPSDGSFEYKKNDKDSSRLPANIKDFYTGKTGAGDFGYVPFSNWYDEYALHNNTTKIFYDKYVEDGSGKQSTEAGYRHASYTDFGNYPAQPYVSRKNGITNLWFLNDFYVEPKTTEANIRNNVITDELLIVDKIKENYDISTEGESTEAIETALKNAIEGDITSISYFPSLKNNEVVSEKKPLTEGEDYELSVEYDADSQEATVKIKGKEGKYSGECRYTVKVNTALVTEAPHRNTELEYDGSSHDLLDRNNPGEATNGEMVYGIGTKDAPPEEFSTDIPRATDAGAYYIWYMAVGDGNLNDSVPQRILQPAMIEPIQPTILEDNRVIRVGDKVKLTPVLDKNMAATFTFKSSDENIVTVSADGTVTGVAEGIAGITIDATLKDKNPNYEDPYDALIQIKVLPKEAQKPDAGTYQNVSGDGNVWYRGSRVTSDFVFKRSADDASTIKHFTGLLVDGERVDEANYIKESGSVVIKLRPTYLKTLALGKHTLKAEFDDGSASARFTVAEEPGSGGTDQDGDSRGASTGDDSNPLPWIMLMIVSLLAAALVMIRNRRKTE